MTWVFFLFQNIGTIEAFLWNLKLSANHLQFWRCDPAFYLKLENEVPAIR